MKLLEENHPALLETLEAQPQQYFEDIKKKKNLDYMNQNFQSDLVELIFSMQDEKATKHYLNDMKYLWSLYQQAILDSSSKIGISSNRMNVIASQFIIISKTSEVFILPIQKQDKGKEKNEIFEEILKNQDPYKHFFKHSEGNLFNHLKKNINYYQNEIKKKFPKEVILQIFSTRSPCIHCFHCLCEIAPKLFQELVENDSSITQIIHYVYESLAKPYDFKTGLRTTSTNPITQPQGKDESQKFNESENIFPSPQNDIKTLFQKFVDNKDYAYPILTNNILDLNFLKSLNRIIFLLENENIS